ncbi:MAG: redoxin domain-containing protein [Bacteroidales bacterium]
MKTLMLFLTLFLASVSGWTQEKVNIPLIGSDAPSFTAASTNGPINFPGDFGRTWKILFAHPRDFTPVCSSEILEMAYSQREFDALNARLLVVSSDPLQTHYDWKAALEEIPYKDRDPVKIKFPLIEDHDYSIVERYGMVHSEAKRGQNIRGVFFIDRDNKVRAIVFYPVEVGRHTGEIIRTLKALQQTDDNYNVSTPANWLPGDPVIINFVTPLIQENMQQEDSPYFSYSWFLTYRKLTPLKEETVMPEQVDNPQSP